MVALPRGVDVEECRPRRREERHVVAGALFDVAAGQPPFMVAIFGGTGDFHTVRGRRRAYPRNQWLGLHAYVP